MKYLEAREQYENRYDSMVIDRCRDIEKIRTGKPPEGVSMEKIKKDYRDKKEGKVKKQSSKISKEEKARVEYVANGLLLFMTKMDLAEKRPETIERWMARDRHRDELLEKTNPTKQYCHQCNNLMDFRDKSLHLEFGKGKSDYVVLFYGCTHCKYGRWTYGDGREYITKENRCEKCYSTKVASKIKTLRNGNTLYTETCSDCGYVRKDTWEKFKEKPVDPNYEADRRRFCVSHYEAVKWKSDLQEMIRVFDEIEAREKDKKPPEEEKNQKKGYKSSKVTL